MARRKDKVKATPTPHSAAASSSTPAQDLLRRVLVGFVTALVVARPLVATEDPGLRSALPDASGMVLTWLWMVALLGWMVYRFWMRQSGVRFGLVEGALLVVVGLNLLSTANVARYKYTAWLATWDWFSFFIAFYLVRRLAAHPGAGQGLLAALLATAVMLSAHAVFQYFVELPSEAARLGGNVEKLQEEMARQGVFREADDPYWEQLNERVEARSVFATFAHPNSFAGWLGLLLPGVLGWTWASWRAGGLNGQTVLLAGCAGLTGLALWWTHSRGAVLAALLVAGVAMLWMGRRLIARYHIRAVGGLVILGLAIAFLGYLGMGESNVGKMAPQASIALRLGYWNATWKMIGEHRWLGVGPGNFGRHYPAYMTPADYEEVQDPHNFALELWATCGFFGMAALLVALGSFFRRCALLSSVPVPVPVPDQAIIRTADPVIRRSQVGGVEDGHGRGHGQGTPWEFYLGGMAGLILGFLLEVWYLSPDEKLLKGVTAGFRSLVWFPAFALFFSARWSGPARGLVLAAGVLVLLLNLCVSGGIAVPAVAISLWVVIALAVASWPSAGLRGRATESRTSGQFAFLGRLLPVPLVAGLVIVYWAMFLEPTVLGARLSRQALKAEEDLQAALNSSAQKKRFREIRRNPAGFVRASILRPLEIAADANPGDARYSRWMADWTAVLWQLTPPSANRDAIRDAAWNHVRRAQGLDPRSRDTWLSGANLGTMFGRYYQLQAWSPILAISTPWGPFPNLQLPPQPLGAFVRIFRDPHKTHEWNIAQLEFENAASALRAAVNLCPTQTHNQFELASATLMAGHPKEAEREAVRLLELDRQSTHPSRKLTHPQREQVQHWLTTRQGK